jgi:Flp pilus assembly protein TadD
MRQILPLILLSIFFTPIYADSDDSGSSYNSDDWRIAKAAKHIKKERYAKAIKQLRKALKKDKDNADAWNLLGFASRKSGDLETSANAYSKALTLDPAHKGALEYQGELFITQGNIEQAQGNLAKLVELCPSGCDERSKLEQALAKLQ